MGVEYFGPFKLTGLRRAENCWCCLFSCLVTRAVDMEMASELDTDASMMAVTRFMARRCRRHTINSDNGTIIMGAAREFKERFNEWD